MGTRGIFTDNFSLFIVFQLVITYLKANSQVWVNFWQLKAFKNDENCFLFHLKSSFRSQDI